MKKFETPELTILELTTEEVTVDFILSAVFGLTDVDGGGWSADK